MSHIILYISGFTTALSYGFVYLLSELFYNLKGDISYVGSTLFYAGITTIFTSFGIGKIARYISPILLCSLGAGMLSLAFVFFSLINTISYKIYFIGGIMGCGWSIYYTASPMILTSLVRNNDLTEKISKLSAFNIIGTSLAPIYGHHVLSIGKPISAIFFNASLIALAAALLFVVQFFCQKKVHHSELKDNRTDNITLLLPGKVKYPIIMGVLGACVFSTLMNFQHGIASSKGLTVSIYYVFYMISALMCRFIIPPLIKQYNQIKLMYVFLVFMIMGLFIIYLNDRSNFFYALGAISLGIGYGVSYPMIKSYAINLSNSSMKQTIVAYFTSAYFVGIYMFPIISSEIIEKYGYDLLSIVLIFLMLVSCIILRLSNKENLHR